MGKNKLKKFAEMKAFTNVFECGAQDINTERDVQYMAGHWGETFFKNDHPIVLELGCGRGEYTVGLARLFPDKNFIGIDIKGARMWAGAKEAMQEGLANAAFLRTNIELLPHFFSPNEVAEIWITFPDPQMKKVTKRLLSTYFMHRYQQVLHDGGIIHLKTDSPFLYMYTDAMVKHNELEVLVNTANLYGEMASVVSEHGADDKIVTPIDEKILSLKTHYEKQWIERGLDIRYIQFRLPHHPLNEPEVEDIPLDTYRSYGRNYENRIAEEQN